MAWTTDDLAAIEAAIATGATSVRYADRTVTYRSLDELMAIRDAIRAAAAPVTSPVRARFACFNRGHGTATEDDE